MNFTTTQHWRRQSLGIGGALFAVLATARCNDQPNPPAQMTTVTTSGSGDSSGTTGAAGSTSMTSGNTVASTSSATSGAGGAASTVASGTGGNAGSTTAGTAGTAGVGGSAGAGGSGGDVDASAGDDADASGGDDGEASSDDGTLPPGAVIGSCIPSRWTTSALGSAPGDQSAYGVDGIQVSRWSSGAPQAVGQYYQIDFRGYVRLSQVLIDSAGSAGDHPRGYQAETSRDGLDFSTVIATGALGDTPQDVVTIDFAPRAIRYLRVELTASSASWWSIHEIHVACQIPDGDGGWAEDPAPPDTGLCAQGTGSANVFNRANWTATASSTSTVGGDAIAKAFDNDVVSRWSSGQAQTGSDVFRLDLGSIGCVGGMTITSPGTDFAKAYAVSVSTDDVRYMVVASGIGQAVLPLTFPPHNARYLRINQFSTTGSWWSISDIAAQP